MYHVGSLRACFLEGHDVDEEVHGLSVSRAEHPDAMLIQHIYQGHKPAHCTLSIMTAETSAIDVRVQSDGQQQKSSSLPLPHGLKICAALGAKNCGIDAPLMQATFSCHTCVSKAQERVT